MPYVRYNPHHRVHQREWAEEETDKLKAMVAEGKLSNREMGERLGRSKNSVVGHMQRENIKSKRPYWAPKPAGAVARPREDVTLPLKRGSDGAMAGCTLFALGAIAKELPPYTPSHVTGPRPANSGCLWPIGEPKRPGFRFCDAPSGEASYCAEHAALAYVPRPRTGRAFQFGW